MDSQSKRPDGDTDEGDCGGGLCHEPVHGGVRTVPGEDYRRKFLLRDSQEGFVWGVDEEGTYVLQDPENTSYGIRIAVVLQKPERAFRNGFTGI